MNLTRCQRLVLGAVEGGCTRPVTISKKIGKSEGNCSRLLLELKKRGVVEKNGKHWSIIDQNWRSYEVVAKKRYDQPKKRTSIKRDGAPQTELDPTLHKLIKVMCFAIDEADDRGIARKEIDMARVLEACRTLDVPRFRWE